MWWRLGTPLCPVTPLALPDLDLGYSQSAGWIPSASAATPRSPVTSLEAAALGPAGSPSLLRPAHSKCPFHLGWALGPPSLPRLGSPREDVTCANHPAFPLPLCREASHFSSQGLALRPSFRRPAQGGPGREVDSPARQMASLTCPLLPATPPPPRPGVEPCPAAPPCPTSRHVLKPKVTGMNVWLPLPLQP